MVSPIEDRDPCSAPAQSTAASISVCPVALTNSFRMSSSDLSLILMTWSAPFFFAMASLSSLRAKDTTVAPLESSLAYWTA